MKTYVLCEQRKRLLREEGHLLVKGDPGSGKTTISLLKAAAIVKAGQLKKGQKILFLSFARATISRVMEDAKLLMDKETLASIEINTYHGFCWSILKSYGRLIVKTKNLSLLTPPEASSVFYKTPSADRLPVARKLLAAEGKLAFDLFAELTAQILKRSTRIRAIYSDAYPVIFVDEFQDTDPNEWELIQQLGITSSIIALADPFQRIYDFRGASPDRLNDFIAHFSPQQFDFKNENNRSGGTDITLYGSHILTGANKGRLYNQVVINRYRYLAEPLSHLKYAILNSIKRLSKADPARNWSVAVLVKSKAITLTVSSFLSKATATGSISHEVLIDPAGPSLAAVIIAGMLEPFDDPDKFCKELIILTISHIRGRKEKITQADLAWTDALQKYLVTDKLTGSKRQEFLTDVRSLIKSLQQLEFTGIPADDWLAVRNLFKSCRHPTLIDVFEDSKYLRLLNKGALLTSRLSDSWRQVQSYTGAQKSVKDALLQEHFSMAHRKWTGVFVMTMHKSKGKEFDEVIIWEDQYHPLVHPDANKFAIEQSKLVLRVGVTRAKKLTTICTPLVSPCILV